MKHFLVLSALILTSCCFFLRPEVSSEAIGNGLDICVNSIFPSLFPCFVIVNLWLALGYIDRISNRLGPYAEKLFHLPAFSFPAVLTGCIAGFPVGAQTVARLYQKEKIDKDTAERILMFCSNAGPAFVIGFVGPYLFQSILIGLILWLIHILSAMFVGIIMRPVDFPRNCNSHASNSSPVLLMDALSKSVLTSGKTLFNISVFVVFFTLFISHIKALLPNHAFLSAANGFMEITSGILSLTSFSKRAAFIFSSVLLSWNGLCIHCQVISSIGSTLSLGRYFHGKLLQIIISTVISALVAPLLPFSTFCSSFSSDNIVNIYILSLCIFIIMWITKTSSGNKHQIDI